jgi:tetratricopeptide (TPR) repeat protein
MKGSSEQKRFPGRLIHWGFPSAALGWLCLISALAQTPANEAVRQAMRQGAEAMTAGNFGAAVAAYTHVTQRSPEFAEGYFNLGLALQQADQLDAARAALEKALRLKPGLRGANLFLGIIAYRENRFKDAESRLLAETRLDPRGAKAFMWLGVCRLAQDDPQAAIAPLDKAYALDPSDVDILYHRGRAYLLVANASYRAMYKLDHDSLRIHQVLAEAYAQAYHNQEAIGEFELAVKMAPRQPGLHEELGDQDWIVGKFDQAAEAYREELRIDPHGVTAMYKLGSLLVQNQNPTEGVQLLRDALRADPSLSDAHYYLASGLMGIDRDQDAIHEFELAIAADPSNDRAMSAYYKLAQVYRKLHKTQEAQAALQNFQRMRADAKERQDRKTAQLARKRTELPVEDPERTAMSADQ